MPEDKPKPKKMSKEERRAEKDRLNRKFGMLHNQLRRERIKPIQEEEPKQKGRKQPSKRIRHRII